MVSPIEKHGPYPHFNVAILAALRQPFGNVPDNHTG